MEFHQIDCLKVHLTFLNILAIWPGDNPSRCYVYYSRLFLLVFVVTFITLYTINFYFLPQQLEIFAEEMIFYFNDLTVLSKVLAFVFNLDKFREMLDILESETFQGDTPHEDKIIKKAKQNALLYWKITAGISIVANSANVVMPMVVHLIYSIDLEFPVCRYSFIPEKYMEIFLYPAYFYQSLGITSHMLYNVNCDTFLLGVMFLAIAQLDILDGKLQKVTDGSKKSGDGPWLYDNSDHDRRSFMEINKCIKHYDLVCKYCKLIEQAFNETIFVQFSLGSCKICVCLFRFTLPAPKQYLIFLSLYMVVMILQIMVPCWYGSQIIEKSRQLSFSVYSCDWTARSRKFKSNLRLLVERAKKPLTITGGKMFLLSLGTFAAIMNSAYSFFTLLRHMQSR
ncbi:odorant receptor 94a-like [Trichoplusia ni]|uniref:Odorant receptor n=1 Tax=Trichoplusia ni TaxID=7111 RepID=A0A7E5VUJ3_TRINI|nr:odorant receptor 94a-like [Trichoplusia ni]